MGVALRVGIVGAVALPLAGFAPAPAPAQVASPGTSPIPEAPKGAGPLFPDRKMESEQGSMATLRGRVILRREAFGLPADPQRVDTLMADEANRRMVDLYATPEESAAVERQLQVQQKSNLMTGDIRADLPNAFAGKTIDHAAGGLVTIYFKEGTGDDVEAARARYGEILGARLVPVRFSYAELMATYDRLAGDLRSSSGALAGVRVTSLAVNEARNLVEVRVSEYLESSIVDLHDYLDGLPVQVVYVAAEASEVKQLEGSRQAFPPGSAGSRWRINGGATPWCTWAFPFFTNNRAGLFTAGHCNDQANIWIETMGGCCVFAGTYTAFWIGNDQDVGIIETTTPLNGRVFYANKTYKHVDFWWDGAPAAGVDPGTYIEISEGRSQQTISGSVLERNVSVNLGGGIIADHFYEISSCARGGDSGSPIYTTESGNPNAGAGALATLTGVDTEGCDGPHLVYGSKMSNNVNAIETIIGEQITVMG